MNLGLPLLYCAYYTPGLPKKQGETALRKKLQRKKPHKISLTGKVL